MKRGWRELVAAGALALLVGLAGCASNHASGPAKQGGSPAKQEGKGAADLPPRLQQGTEAGAAGGAGSEGKPPYAPKEQGGALLSDAPKLSMDEPGAGGKAEGKPGESLDAARSVEFVE